MIGIAAVPTAIEYEHHCTEYRFAEYEYEHDEIRGEARTTTITEWPPKESPSQARPLRRVVRFVWSIFWMGCSLCPWVCYHVNASVALPLPGKLALRTSQN